MATRRLSLALLVHGFMADVFLPASALDNGLGLTPPMGFNTWNVYGCDVDETKIISTMDSIVALGLRDVGYEYVNLDDWYVSWVE
eukprot:CAMPEP_0119535264 /NCGR_PEP_ID=MMETSP1344-20130328/48332_1 /TAXON_ID=236787 /ORGANISM="Florenciella parvula, Strain CCMP2471" /LENGTH=84 /DNA_ID=CAMNT_0007576809 /DNA_START=32 /DNA_END=286 /DNA_ORIENTATION=+